MTERQRDLIAFALLCSQIKHLYYWTVEETANIYMKYRKEVEEYDVQESKTDRS